MLVIAVVASIIVSCSHNPAVDRRLNVAENLMEEHPDSALLILNEIDTEQIESKVNKARYALLKSMALDKNYIDTTTFDVIRPAIDYYIEDGSPNEKLRTYYYQGRVYQNRSENDSAMQSFMRGREFCKEASDTLTMANLLVAQAAIQYSIYKLNEFINNNLEAANLYKAIGRKDYEILSLANALDGGILNNDKFLTDSIMSIAKERVRQNPEFTSVIAPYELSYALKFGNEDSVVSILNYYKSDKYLEDVDKLDIAEAYCRIGDGPNAMRVLSSIPLASKTRSSLKYLAIKPAILELNGDISGALSAYRLFSTTIDSLHQQIFSQDLLFADKKHQFEMDVLRERTQRERFVWIALGVILLLIIIYQIWVMRLRTEHENDLLKIQTLQQNLFESSQKQNEAKERIQKLFHTRFLLLDGLASSYFESKETGHEQKRIFAEVKESINNFRSEGTVIELTEIVNGYNNGLMDRFKDDFPKLSKSRFRFALYLFCRFSLPSISIFTDTELRNVYVHKSRLKSVVSGSDSPHKAEYLRYFE